MERDRRSGSGYAGYCTECHALYTKELHPRRPADECPACGGDGWVAAAVVLRAAAGGGEEPRPA